MFPDVEASQEDIEEACKFAAADEFINKLPEKFNTNRLIPDSHCRTIQGTLIVIGMSTGTRLFRCLIEFLAINVMRRKSG